MVMVMLVLVLVLAWVLASASALVLVLVLLVVSVPHGVVRAGERADIIGGVGPLGGARHHVAVVGTI